MYCLWQNEINFSVVSPHQDRDYEKWHLNPTTLILSVFDNKCKTTTNIIFFFFSRLSLFEAFIQRLSVTLNQHTIKGREKTNCLKQFKGYMGLIAMRFLQSSLHICLLLFSLCVTQKACDFSVVVHTLHASSVRSVLLDSLVNAIHVLIKRFEFLVPRLYRLPLNQSSEVSQPRSFLSFSKASSFFASLDLGKEGNCGICLSRVKQHPAVCRSSLACPTWERFPYIYSTAIFAEHKISLYINT